jgi:RNA polymerase-binding protein DksA
VAKSSTKNAKPVKKTAKRAGPPASHKPVEAPRKPAPAAKRAAPEAVVKAPVKAPVKPAEPEFNERAVPLTSVPTNGKPRKNQAGLNTRELEGYRALLLEKRRELAGDMSSLERDALGAGGGTNLSNLPMHMADMGTDNYEQEFSLGLMEKDRKLLKEINRALAKIQDGSYGICERTGKPISKPRLEAQPWARYSIEYARKLERGLIGRPDLE